MKKYIKYIIFLILCFSTGLTIGQFFIFIFGSFSLAYWASLPLQIFLSFNAGKFIYFIYEKEI